MADPIAAAAVAPVNAPEVWTVNPLATNFNPGSKGGNQIFLEKSKGPIDGKRIGDTIADSQTLHSFLKTKGITFGPVVTHVPFQFDATGNPTNFASIIEQYQSLDLEHVQYVRLTDASEMRWLMTLQFPIRVQRRSGH
jgi:hypothetical protein